MNETKASTTARIAAAGTLTGLLLLAAPATAGNGHTKKIKDERSTGSLYDAKTYAQCDIRKMTVTSKRGKLIVNLTYRAKAERGAIDQLLIDTKGGKKSKPEYLAQGYDGSRIQKIKGFQNGNGYPFYEDDPDAETVQGKSTNGGKGQSVKLPLKAFGKPKKLDKLGVQARTCGEGAVDIAPGGDYFKDKNYDGTIKFKSLVVKV